MATHTVQSQWSTATHTELTCTQHLNLGEVHLQRLIDPNQHVVSAQVFAGDWGGVDVHSHRGSTTNPHTHSQSVVAAAFYLFSNNKLLCNTKQSSQRAESFHLSSLLYKEKKGKDHVKEEQTWSTVVTKTTVVMTDNCCHWAEVTVDVFPSGWQSKTRGIFCFLAWK